VRLAPEGGPFVVVGFTVLALAGGSAWMLGGAWWLVPGLWLPIALWIPWFFRNPDRRGPRGEHLVIAPADGRVVAVVDDAEPDFVRGPARRISVFMNVFDVHVNRFPVDGRVEHRHYRPGKFLNASRDKASADNEQMSLGIKCPRGPVLVRQIAGLVARRIVCDPTVGDLARQGERLGLIRFGSRVDTYVPPDAVARVAVGNRIKAGITVIAEWTS
jgi:phosphatidylserine decarboxylase